MTTSDDTVADWLLAAGFCPDDETMRSPVRKAGEFLRNNGDLTPDEVGGCVAEIDFRSGLIVVRLPASVFVRRDESSDSVWLTDLGLSVDLVRPVASRARRTLLTPMGPVAALRATPLEVPATMTPDQIFQGLPPAVRAEMSKGSPMKVSHYIVPNGSRLRTVR